ncbi:MAG: hypothetical protein AAFV47_14975, partial [Pseudomonadota bacterium]
MHFDSIQQISERLRNGETTSLALTEHLLERITRFDDDLNAYITVTTDTAIQAAEAAARSVLKSPLRPVSSPTPAATTMAR